MISYRVTYKFKGKETWARILAEDAKDAEEIVLTTFRKLDASVIEFISAIPEKSLE